MQKSTGSKPLSERRRAEKLLRDLRCTRGSTLRVTFHPVGVARGVSAGGEVPPLEDCAACEEPFGPERPAARTIFGEANGG